MSQPSADPDVPLVSTEWLGTHLVDPDLSVLEISSDTAADAEYFKGHVPGSRFAYWKDLLWHETDRQFPSPSTMAERLSSLGFPAEGRIALLGDPVQFSTYAYWVMTMTGQGSRFVHVDGGREKWVSEGRPLTTDVPSPATTTIEPGSPDESCRIGRDEVRDGLENPQRLVIDARSPEEYAGERVSPDWFEVDYGAERTGRIPGARHLYYTAILTEDGAYLPPEELRARLGDLPVDSSEVITYCRLSHRATLVWFALKYLLGVQNVRVYDGSWTEWGSIVGFPIERPE